MTCPKNKCGYGLMAGPWISNPKMKVRSFLSAQMSVTKKCYGCDQSKPVELFSINSAKKDGLHNKCKACHKIYRDKHYRQNKEKYIKKARDYTNIVRLFIQEAKSRPCKDCGKQYPYYVMDFDHLDSKQKSFSLARGSDFSISKIQSEIEKCEVVCSNCHRIRTHNRRK